MPYINNFTPSFYNKRSNENNYIPTIRFIANNQSLLLPTPFLAKNGKNIAHKCSPKGHPFIPFPQGSDLPVFAASGPAARP
jgi:hypothetical protein